MKPTPSCRILKKKAQYDTLRKTYGSAAANRFKQNYSDQDIFRGSDIGQIFEELSRAFGLRGFEDVFKEAYGSGFRTFEFRRPNVYGKVFMGGQNRAGGMPREFPLGGNLGRLLKYGIKKKWGIEFPEKGKDIHDIIAISPEMMQSGGKIDYTCRKNDRELRITIPPGIREGQKIRLRQMGEPGKGGAEAGDLYVEVQARNPLLQKISRSAKGIFATLKNLGR